MQLQPEVIFFNVFSIFSLRVSSVLMVESKRPQLRNWASSSSWNYS